jgi:hypothetical protein
LRSKANAIPTGPPPTISTSVSYIASAMAIIPLPMK